jgi:putative ABC transport system permease protein
MKIIKFYKRARFFLLTNIIGLAIGFAVSIMLLLLIVNELGYDRHFANNDRIVRLNSVFDDGSLSLCLWSAYTELPSKVPGIDCAVQFYESGEEKDAVVEQQTFRRLKTLYVSPEFFKVFQMKFIDGTTDNALKEPNSLVITKRCAEIMFVSADKAIDNQISIDEKNFTVSGIVNELPANTHFTFDMLMNIPESNLNKTGCEYHTYYLINKEVSLRTARKNIETEYTSLMNKFYAEKEYYTAGYTEKLTDIYLHSKSESYSFAKTGSIDKIWLLTVIAISILFLAITNFVNLFVTHGEARMKEVGIRKANGAGIWDIIRQFFSEISAIVFIAFVLGFILAVHLIPYFSQLIKSDVSLTQLISPAFIISVMLLYVLIVVLSAGYPAFYLSRFNPLDILFKRIRFSKCRLTAGVVVFQSIITLVLMSYIFTMYKQTKYLEDCAKGYNPQNVVSLNIRWNRNLHSNYNRLRQELMQFPEIQKISGSDHLIGGVCSGQYLTLLEDNTKDYEIKEYRIIPELCEMLELQLVEGNFLDEEDRRDTVSAILLNETAVKMLGLEQPVTGKYVKYNDESAKIAGVIKDFYYDSPGDDIKPLVISFCFGEIGSYMYFKFGENVSRKRIMELLTSVFKGTSKNLLYFPNCFLEFFFAPIQRRYSCILFSIIFVFY